MLQTGAATLLTCAIVGAVGLAALVALPARWACFPLALLMIGDFGLVGFIIQAEMMARTPTAAAAYRRLRAFANVVAVVGAIATGVAVLALLFGGSVGVMRVQHRALATQRALLEPSELWTLLALAPCMFCCSSRLGIDRLGWCQGIGLETPSGVRRGTPWAPGRIAG